MKDSFRVWMIVLMVIGIMAVVGLPAFAIVKFYQSAKSLDQGMATVNSFEECVAAGNPVMESYPRQCRAGGQTFVEDIGNELEKQDLIRISEPRPGTVVSSPLKVKGEARGTWYFEASFPVRLLDSNGQELAVAPAQAQGEWMTEEFVPFEVTLQFAEPLTTAGTLVLEKDNPSGLPEHADELRVPVRFGELKENGNRKMENGVGSNNRAQGGCVITGCSAQVCADEDVATTCEFREEYACFATATCERQTNGQCGWTQTNELKACLEEKGVDTGEVRRMY